MILNITFVILSLAAFLLALRVMRQGLEGMGEGRLKAVLQRVVRTPTRGVLTGLVTTALLQSSAAVTAITVGLVASGTMVFRDAVGVVLGSNVGSTVTPQLLTMDLWVFAVPCFVLGAGLLLFGSRRFRHASMALIGFSSVFVALEALSTALHPLAGLDEFEDVLAAVGSHPALAVLAGAVISALVQSSTATTVLAMALASDAAIPSSGGIAIVIGANVGTCLTSVIAALGQSRSAQQVALSHVLLNVAGAIVFLPFISPFETWLANLSEDPAQQIANAHTIFNVVCTVAVWPFTGQFGRFVEWILPDSANERCA